MNRTAKPQAARRSLEIEELGLVFHQSLSLGIDLDGRGLHWRLPKEVAPEQRLAFALAVYFTGGLYVMIDADRGFLCVERIAQQFAKLEKERRAGSYRTGHAFAQLHEALGYGHQETIGFSLIRHSDLASVEGFVKGFADSMRLSVEADVMGLLTGARTDHAALVERLRHFIDDHVTVCAVSKIVALQEGSPGGPGGPSS